MMTEQSTPHRRAWRAVTRWVVLPAAGVLAVITLSDKLPALGDVTSALRGADTGWLLVAFLAEGMSMGMFARQQRRLLMAFGVTMPRHRALALAYSRSAIAISVPAGSAVSAAYAFRYFRADGASRSVAASVMVLSGLLSFAALALVSASGGLAAGVVQLADAWAHDPVAVQLAASVTLALLVLITLIAWQGPSLPHPHRAAVTTDWPAGWPRLAAVLRPVRTAIADSRSVAPRHWALALGSASANWVTDLLCLAATAAAFHLPVSLWHLGTVYLTVQLVRQIPLTPGGIGVIEVSLLAGLISAGAAAGPAAAVVLTYRVLSCWLLLPAGLVGWLVLRGSHAGRRTGSADAAEPVTADTPRPAVPA